ncbi:hypothetical protein FRC06_007844 [Ceratobasidium sp. 370]|nr:hypothetical protein FRC06_007844 [Ceratobasidium sp. 370]
MLSGTRMGAKPLCLRESRRQTTCELSARSTGAEIQRYSSRQLAMRLHLAGAAMCVMVSIVFRYFREPRHRHTDAHGCVPVSGPPVVDKKAEAQALLTKLFPDAKAGGTSTGRVRPPPTDPVKQAKLRAIELMKMKHKAVSADPSLARGSGIQAGDRIHLRVTYAPLKSDKVLWYRKDIVTGKAVDLAGRALSVSREDGRGMRFVRGREIDGALDLKNDLTLGGQVEDGDEVQLVKDDL